MFYAFASRTVLQVIYLNESTVTYLKISDTLTDGIIRAMENSSPGAKHAIEGSQSSHLNPFGAVNKIIQLDVPLRKWWRLITSK